VLVEYAPIEPVQIDPEATDRELRVQLETELAFARAERDAHRVRSTARRSALLRFLLIVLVLLTITATFAYLSLEALRDSFGA